MKRRYLIAGATGIAGAALAAKLLSRPVDIVWAKHARDIHHAEYSYFAVVEGVRVHYQEAGPEDGPVVFLIHGFCASNLVWSDVFLKIAAAGYRVIAPDLVGFGFSEKPAHAEYSIEMQARTVVHLMDELGIERASMVGSSYGGAVSAVCAMDYPERVEKLCMVGAVINDEAKHQLLLRLAATPVMGDLISPLILDSTRLMRWRMSQIYAPENAQLMTAERMLATHRPLRTANSHRAVLKTLRKWKADRVEREAVKIRKPTLLVWGEGDAECPLEHGRRLFNSIENSRLIVFTNCGHLPQEEYPDQFVELVTGFLSGEAQPVLEERVRVEQTSMPVPEAEVQLSGRRG